MYGIFWNNSAAEIRSPDRQMRHMNRRTTQNWDGSPNHPPLHWETAWGRFKNAYELFNLRALKITMLYKNHIFQCMGNIFCVEFQRVPRISAGHAKSSGSCTAAARIHTILDSKEPIWSVVSKDTAVGPSCSCGNSGRVLTFLRMV